MKNSLRIFLIAMIFFVSRSGLSQESEVSDLVGAIKSQIKVQVNKSGSEVQPYQLPVFIKGKHVTQKTLDTLDFSEVKEIKISLDRTYNSALYGTSGRYGVINISTKDPSADKDKEIEPEQK